MSECLHRRQHAAMIPNSTQLMWSEVDLLSVTKAGLVHEFEIKTSRSDYNRELGDNRRYNKASKHYRLQNPGSYMDKSHIPNYFWFVTYGFEIEPPRYAGWMTVEDGWKGGDHFLREKKKAPRLHTNKWNDRQVARLARLLSFRLLKVYKDEASVPKNS